ncbi:MAG: hypothetical protein AAFX93_17050 [Verrucomicrobiota bacterium]
MKQFYALLSISLACILADARTHEFDDDGRLIRVAYLPGGGIAYTYDAAGNLLTVTALDLPATPTNFNVVRGEAGEAILSWEDAADNETEYQVYRRDIFPSGEFDHRPTLVTTLPANSTGFTHSSLSQQRNYYYWVVAVGADGPSAETEPLLALDPNPFTVTEMSLEILEQSELVSVTFPSVSGTVYSAQYSTNLLYWDYIPVLQSDDPNVFVSNNGLFILGNFSGDETTVTIELPSSDVQSFVRVVLR